MLTSKYHPPFILVQKINSRIAFHPLPWTLVHALRCFNPLCILLRSCLKEHGMESHPPLSSTKLDNKKNFFHYQQKELHIIPIKQNDLDQCPPPCLGYTAQKWSTSLRNLHHLHAPSCSSLPIPPSTEHLHHNNRVRGAHLFIPTSTPMHAGG
ncbi:hypothetical protein V8G54_020342 [Vigna mungo]|uniref:Uncharacterized protein n=1 Tax=Vigna mungo TaxID=3915 RepID=A0AAQ3NDG9_VIGMU